MKIKEGQERFVQAWGTLGAQWGINRTMAQIHAVLFLSPEAMTTDEIMERLGISRGNANMNLRALIDWGIVFKEFKPGHRKEFFHTTKDTHQLARQVMKERRRREIEPVLNILSQIQDVKDDGSEEAKEFLKVTKEMKEFVEEADQLAAFLSKAEKSWFASKLIKLIK